MGRPCGCPDAPRTNRGLGGAGVGAEGVEGAAEGAAAGVSEQPALAAEAFPVSVDEKNCHPL